MTVPVEVADGWQQRVLAYWRAAESSPEAMAGEGASQADLITSASFMASLQTRRGGKSFHRALDVGAGIGRVADAILAKHCDTVDLLEPVEGHLLKAQERLREQRWFGHCHCALAQDFDFEFYGPWDLVWCQWLLMYLSDTDASAVLRRIAKSGVRRHTGPASTLGSALVVKENVPPRGLGTYFELEDGRVYPGPATSRGAQPVAVIRSPRDLERLFRSASLVVETQERCQEPEAILYSLVPQSQH